MIAILDWIFEGIADWIASIVTDLMDAVSGLFLEALGTDMTAMEEYFPFVTKAYTIMQYTAWTVLALIFVWQLFRAFGGPITEAENPWHLLVRGSLFALLIGYARPVFNIILNIATAPYTSLLEVTMNAEDFTFAGIGQVITSGLVTVVSMVSVVGTILLIILMIALGWNYFKLLLETVERYIVVGVLCYTSPLAFSMGGSKATNQVFKSWCRMVGSQLLLLVMNVWFLRGFNSSMGQFAANGGALSTGKGSIFLWMFCALAFLKCAQRFDSYLASIGLNVAQTGSSMGMELLMAARVITGIGSGARSAGSVFGRAGGAAGTVTGTGAAANGFVSGFVSRFKPNSYVRDAVVDGGTRMGFGGGAGFVGRAFGGIAARNGATLTGESISSVASRSASASGTIGGEIADKSLANYMPQMKGYQLSGTQISGGHIRTTATGQDGKSAEVEMYSTGQFEKPEGPHSVVTASDGSQWYQIASGSGQGAFYDAPAFTGAPEEAAQVAAAFPDAPEGTSLRTVEDGVMEATQMGAGFTEFPGGAGCADVSMADMPESGGAGFTEMPESGSFVSESGMMDTPVGTAGSMETPEGGSLAGEGGMMDTPVGTPGFTETPEGGSFVGEGGMMDAPVGTPGFTETPEGGSFVGEGGMMDTPVGTPGFTETPEGGSFVGGGGMTDMPQPASGFTEAPNGDSLVGGMADTPQMGAGYVQAPDGTPLYTGGDGTPTAAANFAEDSRMGGVSAGGTAGYAMHDSGENAGAGSDGGTTRWYSSAYYEEPDAPHTVMHGANGVDWYAMQQHAEMPQFEAGESAHVYNQAAFQQFMPGYDQKVSQVDGSHRQDGHFEVRHEDGSGTMFYDTARYQAPRGDYQVYEDARGSQWYAIQGKAAVERRPLYQDGKPMYDGANVKTVTVDTVRYPQTPAKYSEPKKRGEIERKAPKKKV